jgi:membrane-associated phospholipid phosphatase
MKRIFNKLNLAKFISGLLSPFIIISAMLLFVLFYYYGSFVKNLPNALISLFFTVVVPGITIVWLYKHKLIKDIHLNKRSERQIPLLMCIASAVSGLMFLVLIGSPKYLLAVSMMFILNCLAVFLITFFWKISIHAATYAAAATVVLFIDGSFWWFLYFGLILVGWARVYEKKHTLAQIIGGSVLAIILTVFIFNMFGFSIFVR